MCSTSFLGSSSFCVACASGKTTSCFFSLRKVVVTIKKISRRNAMSASDDDGMSLAAFDFRLSPPPRIISRSLQDLQRDLVRLRVLQLVEHVDHEPVRRVRRRLVRRNEIRVLCELLAPDRANHRRLLGLDLGALATL